jgi:galactoside O-acetyltransferase
VTPAERFALAACGDDVIVHDWVKILGGEHVRVGSHVLIDDFVFLDGRGGLDIGSWTHVSMFVSIHGRGRVRLGDFVNLAAGARLIAGVDSFAGDALVGAPVPDAYRNVHRGTIEVEEHAFVGANAVVLPDVTIGEGAVVGAGSVVNKDVAPWTVVAGAPARVIRTRPKQQVIDLAAELRRSGG